MVTVGTYSFQGNLIKSLRSDKVDLDPANRCNFKGHLNFEIHLK